MFGSLGNFGIFGKAGTGNKPIPKLGILIKGNFGKFGIAIIIVLLV